MTEIDAADDLADSAFWKSSFSGNAGCVEVSIGPEAVYVRDSKDPDGAVLSFTAHEWTAFILGVRAGEFDKPMAPGRGS